MKHYIVEHSLIERISAAVSIEISELDVTPVILNELCDIIRQYVTGNSSSFAKKLYVVESLLSKYKIMASDAEKLENFVMSDKVFIPVLVGENSYMKNTDYLGFKASKETIITL